MGHHVVLYSGGHASAIVAIEVVRKYGAENVILLSHDINPDIEDTDIKRFRLEVAKYLGIEITHANHSKWETATPISVCLEAKAWKVGAGSVLCTNRLKTAPFDVWLKENDPDGNNIYYYGFEGHERHRIQRRSGILGERGYRTEFPYLWKERTIHDVSDIGIAKPLTYGTFKHANCIGCLKAGWQHWYCVYCLRPDIWQQAKKAEDEIGYAIHKDKDGPVYLEDKESLFEQMKLAGVPATEHIQSAYFWSMAKKLVAGLESLDETSDNEKPCECST
ncbi:hypothetical protein [Yersinia frederiksenii]|uniref:hypothetical protein n=1 Tax=Yersinia frederiksenii TaxID=29484 RepID=UPI000BFC973E|nr:hypothetical protein [Yersinia frederiksenii]ATM86181.1 hypothetical protein CRN74_08850 [Yersinia frederiksenii]